MSTRVQKMIQATEYEVVALKRFFDLYSKNKEKLFCFIEGEEDEIFYYRPINENSNFKPKFVVCDGKDNVIFIFKELSRRQEYEKARTAYFIDRDYDESVKGEYFNLYETPCYSIENLFTSEEVFKKLLESESLFGIDELDCSYKKILEMYRELQIQFHNVVSILNAWIYFQREKEREHHQKRKLGLDAVKYSNLYHIKLTGISCKYDIEKIKKWFPNGYDIDNDRINEIESFLKEQNRQKIFRGKYEFDFLCKFLGIIIEEYNNCIDGSDSILTRKAEMKKITYRVSENVKDMIRNLSMYVEVPECLAYFIKGLNDRYKEVS